MLQKIQIVSIVEYKLLLSHIIIQYIVNCKRVLSSLLWSCNFTFILLLPKISIYFDNVFLNIEINYKAWYGAEYELYEREERIFIELCNILFLDWEEFFDKQFL